MDRKKIEKASSDIYSKYYEQGAPVEKLLKIIENEGLDYSEIQSENDNFLGALVKIPNMPLHIMIRDNIKPTGRKNFTIAHELGHYVLEHHLNGSSIVCNNISEDDKSVSSKENEANYFARCFLMPRNRIIKEFTNWFEFKFPQTSEVYLYVEPKGKKWQNWKIISSQLMKQFGVSEAALKIRLVEMGLINNF